MASTPNNREFIIWKAAMILPQRAVWPQVEFTLQEWGVDISERKPDAWMDLYNKYRNLIEDIRNQNREPSPPASGKKSPVADITSLPESANPFESSLDPVCALIISCYYDVS
jgi:hypothetical protein